MEQDKMTKPRWITTYTVCRLTRKDGTLVWINIYFSIYEWVLCCNQMPEINGVYRSITEAKKAAIAKFERIESQND